MDYITVPLSPVYQPWYIPISVWKNEAFFTPPSKHSVFMTDWFYNPEVLFLLPYIQTAWEATAVSLFLFN